MVIIEMQSIMKSRSIDPRKISIIASILRPFADLDDGEHYSETRAAGILPSIRVGRLDDHHAPRLPAMGANLLECVQRQDLRSKANQR